MSDKYFDFTKALEYLKEGKKLVCSTLPFEYICYKNGVFKKKLFAESELEYAVLDAEDILLAKWAVYEDKHKCDFNTCITGAASAAKYR